MSHFLCHRVVDFTLQRLKANMEMSTKATHRSAHASNYTWPVISHLILRKAQWGAKRAI